MRTTFYTSRSAMMAQQSKLDLISNNIANSSTTGYKKLTTSFQDLYKNSLDRLGIPAGENKEDLYVGSGVKSTTAVRNQKQGSIRNTGVNTDFAIEGEGMFKVYKSDGTEAYTRNGSFVIDSVGNLVDGNGYRLSIVDDNGNEINVPGGVSFKGGNITVDSTGTVYTDVNGTTTKVGQMRTYRAVGDNDFISVGESLFAVPDGVEVFETQGDNIIQGYLENSNVDMATEMSEMIVAQRAFQFSSTALRTADEMWSMVNSLR